MDLTNAVLSAHQIADEVLRPTAEHSDRVGVPRSHLDALAAAGLVGLAGRPEYGGSAAPAATLREVNEVLAGASLATWFVLTQHAMPLAVLGASSNDDLQGRLLRGLSTGTVLAGVAVAHLRRSGTPAVSATRVAGGWRFDGHVGWMTSWGIADVFLLGGLSPSGEVVFGLVPAQVAAGLTASAPMELLAVQGTQTVTLDLDGFVVADADVAQVVAFTTWSAIDAGKTANVTPAVFGVQAEALRLLEQTATERGDNTARMLARRLREEADDLRSSAYALIDHVPAKEQIPDRLGLRAQALELCLRTASALITVVGGAAMAATHPAQRHLREAAFLLVQAQNGAVREATLQRLMEQS